VKEKEGKKAMRRNDIWSRAWCQTQTVPNFALKGLSALKRRSRTPLFASSLPGRRHQENEGGHQ